MEAFLILILTLRIKDIGSNASLPSNPSPDLPVDLIFIDYIEAQVLPALHQLGGKYSMKDISYYINSTFSTNT